MKVNITEEDQEWGTKKVTISEGLGYCPPMSAADHRAKSKDHMDKADELVSGAKKDSHIAAGFAHNRAAEAIDQADLSTKKAEAFD